MNNPPPHPSLTATKHLIPSIDGTLIPVWHLSASTNLPTIPQKPLPTTILVHGGAFISGGLRGPLDPSAFWPKQFSRDWLQKVGGACLYVDYRLAYGYASSLLSSSSLSLKIGEMEGKGEERFGGVPFPKPWEDIYATLLWTRGEDAKEAGVDRENVILVGISAGAALVLAAVSKARDCGMSGGVRGVMLIYPMVDPSYLSFSSTSTSTKESKEKEILRLGWEKYLEGHEESEAARYAKPLKQDFRGWPRVYMDVGTEDRFLEEVRDLRGLIRGEGKVEVEYWEWKGVGHGFEREEGGEELKEEARGRRAKWLRRVQVGVRGRGCETEGGIWVAQ